MTVSAGTVPAVGTWQPIETAPEKGLLILLTVISPSEWHVRLHSVGNASTGKLTLNDATHWMPVPPPPANAGALVLTEVPREPTKAMMRDGTAWLRGCGIAPPSAIALGLWRVMHDAATGARRVPVHVVGDRT